MDDLKKDFIPSGKIQIHEEETRKNYRVISSIQYQRGTIGTHTATKFFLHGKEAGIKIDKSPKKHPCYKDSLEESLFFSVFEDDISENILNENTANEMREKALSGAVSTLFQQFGFKIEKEPDLFEKKPDLLVTRGEIKCYIELKAFFKESPCFELEIGQALTYLAYAFCKAGGLPYYKPKPTQDQNFNDKLLSLSNFPTVILITSGVMVPELKNIFLKGLDTDILHIKIQEKADQLINDLKNKPFSLDQIASIGRIKHWSKKFDNFQWFFPPKEFIQYFSTVSEFKQFLAPNSNGESGHGVLYLVDAKIFAELLKSMALDMSYQQFQKLRNTTLEEIMVFPERFST